MPFCVVHELRRRRFVISAEATNSEQNCQPWITDILTFLKACTRQKDLDRGIQVHSYILKEGLLEKDSYIACTLIHMYAKCGAFAQAAGVLDVLHVRTLAHWNALISGYAQLGQEDAVLKCFEQLQGEGLCPNAITYTCILKACGSIGAIDKGTEIHDNIEQQRWLLKDPVLGNTLVNMYAKCGALPKAVEVLKNFCPQNVVAWSALIAGFVQQGQNDEAVKCYGQLKRKGITPNMVTFTCTLKACVNKGALDMGKQIHSEIARLGLLGKDIALDTTLVDMYAKCGEMSQAAELFEELPVRDVVSWNALIAGYVEEGHAEEALKCFERLQCERLSLNTGTFICLLQACGNIGAIDKGEQIHSEISRLGLLRENIVIGTPLVDMYVKCGALAKAAEVLDELPVRNVISWNILLAGYSQQGQAEEALKCFRKMECEGFSPTALTFTHILKACSSLGIICPGEQIYNEIVREGLLRKDIILASALVGMYARCCELETASRVLNELPAQDVSCWNALIEGYVQQGHGEEVLKCFSKMLDKDLLPDTVTFTFVLKACSSIGAVNEGEDIHHKILSWGLLGKDILLDSALVDMYAKCGALVKAAYLLHELPIRSVASWNAVIAGYVQQGLGEEALKCFEWMQHEGLSPDPLSYGCILRAYGIMGPLDKREHIFDQIVRNGLLGNDIVLESLMDMHVKWGAFAEARDLLEILPIKNIGSWNALIAGYAKHGQGKKALLCYEQMIQEGFYPDMVTYACVLKACGSSGLDFEGQQIQGDVIKQFLSGKNLILGTAFVDMYVKCGALEEAARVFDELHHQDAVSWTALITGYVQQGQFEEALQCLKQMLSENLSPDAVALACMLKVCGSIGALEWGETLHKAIVRHGLLGKDIVLDTALVDMYAKCGALVLAAEVLNNSPVYNVVTWSALIMGYAQHGQGREALKCFQHMCCEGISPDAVSLNCVLSACSHAGLMDEGQLYFLNMGMHYGIRPDLEHHTCFVDLFCRVGEFDKALAVIEKIPLCNYLPMWHGLLCACQECGNLKLGRLAFDNAVYVDRNDATSYSLMIKTYAVAGNSSDLSVGAE